MLGLQNTIRADQSLLRLLLNHLPHCAAALFDRDLRIVCAGGELLSTFGFGPDTEGRLVTEIFNPERAEMLTHWFVTALQGETMNTTWPYADKVLNIKVRPVRGASIGTQPLGVCIVQDLQALTAAQADELREEHNRASVLKDLELMQTKARVIERILHEFRNPLASVASSADILNKYGDSIPDEKRQEHIERIIGEAHRLAGILDDILTLFS
jgi:signal transduction histidine kinase